MNETGSHYTCAVTFNFPRMEPRGLTPYAKERLRGVFVVEPLQTGCHGDTFFMLTSALQHVDSIAQFSWRTLSGAIDTMDMAPGGNLKFAEAQRGGLGVCLCVCTYSPDTQRSRQKKRARIT